MYFSRSPRSLRFKICIYVLLASLTTQSGCTRKFYRNQADKEVDCILTEKNVHDAWRIDGSYHLPPDADGFADPSCPDRPPMPPDDPATKKLSPNPQKPGKAGVGNFEGTGYLELMASWDAENRAKQPPEDPNAVPATPGMTGPPIKRTEPLDKGLESKERPFLITIDQSVELACSIAVSSKINVRTCTSQPWLSRCNDSHSHISSLPPKNSFVSIRVRSGRKGWAIVGVPIRRPASPNYSRPGHCCYFASPINSC